MIFDEFLSWKMEHNDANAASAVIFCSNEMERNQPSDSDFLLLLLLLMFLLL